MLSILCRLPCSDKYTLAKNLTRHIGKRQIQKTVKGMREAIGVKAGENRLVVHGWRYTATRHLAGAGCGGNRTSPECETAKPTVKRQREPKDRRMQHI